MHQQKYTLFAAILLTLLCAPAWAKMSASQQAFVHRLLPAIRSTNETWRSQRERLLKLKEESSMNTADTQWVQQLCQRYGVRYRQKKRYRWEALLRHVDTVPASLALAQAINESAWGQSRFAQEANNLFGLWCFKLGCGIVPRQRPSGQHHEVQRFLSWKDSVKAYINTLNTRDTYQPFRRLRAEQRTKQSKLSPLALLPGLAPYNPDRKTYTDRLRRLIVNYTLNQFDKKPTKKNK